MQLYNLGKWVREKYGNFIPKHYSEADVKISSTDTHRCLTSAAAFAAGLFPPKDFEIWNEDIHWQPIPIFTECERILSKFITSPCKKFIQVRNDYFKNSEYVKKFKKENDAILDYLRNHAGQNFDNLLKTLLVVDTLVITRELNFTRADWMKNLDYDHLNEMILFGIRGFGTSEDILRLTTGNFVGHIFDHFAAIQAGKHKEKLLFFSAHDINMISILVALGNKETERPAYGSMLIFQLIKKDENHYIQVVMKQNDRILKVPISVCESDDCSAMDLRRAFGRILITEKEWREECDNVTLRDEL